MILPTDWFEHGAISPGLAPYMKMPNFAHALRGVTVAILLVAAATTAAEPANPHEIVINGLVRDSVLLNEDAKRVLHEMAHERMRIDALYAAEERRCHATFFVTSCLLEAKEHHYVASQEIRAIEVATRRGMRRTRAVWNKKGPDIGDKTGGQVDNLVFDSKSVAMADSATDDKIEVPAKAVLSESALDAARREDRRARKVAAYQRKARLAKARQERIAQRKASRIKEKAASGTSVAEAVE